MLEWILLITIGVVAGWYLCKAIDAKTAGEGWDDSYASEYEEVDLEEVDYVVEVTGDPDKISDEMNELMEAGQNVNVVFKAAPVVEAPSEVAAFYKVVDTIKVEETPVEKVKPKAARKPRAKKPVKEQPAWPFPTGDLGTKPVPTPWPFPTSKPAEGTPAVKKPRATRKKTESTGPQ